MEKVNVEVLKVQRGEAPEIEKVDVNMKTKEDIRNKGCGDWSYDCTLNHNGVDEKTFR